MPGLSAFRRGRAPQTVLNERPFGVGGGGFELLSPIYIPEVVAAHDGEPRSVHNTYLLLATEWGVPDVRVVRGVSRFHDAHPQSDTERSLGNDEVYYKSVAIQVGLISTLTSGIFSNRLSGESIYWLCALAFALYRSRCATSTLQPPRSRAAEEAEAVLPAGGHGGGLS